MIWNAILKLVWFIFIQGPLSIINAFNKVLEYLTGGIITDILFGTAKEFQWNNVPMQFWWFVVIALCLFALIFTIQMIVLMFKEAVETKTKFVLAIQNGVKAFCFMFLIPIFFFMTNFLVQNIANTVINNFGSGSNIAEYLYHIGDPNWDGNPVVGGGFPPPGNLGDYNMIVQIFGTWFMLFAIFIIGIILVQKIIELFFLFIISPVVMIVMVVDDGKAAFTWKDMVGAKFLASTATLIGYYVFISVTQLLLTSDLSSLKGVDWAKPLFIILFLCGGGLATMAFSDIVANFLGESTGIREGRASFKSTMAGGMMAMGAAKMTGKALGFMKSKRAQKGLDDDNGNTLDGTSQSNSNKTGLNATTFRNAAVGMASRTGIVGLAGIAAGVAGLSVGHMRAGSKKSWNTNSRKGFWAKSRGVARVIGKAAVAPVVIPAMAFGTGFKNTSTITKKTAEVAKEKNINNHQNLFEKQSIKNNKIIKSVNAEIKKTAENNGDNNKLDESWPAAKKQMKRGNKSLKAEDKEIKLQKKIKKHGYDKKPKDEV